MTAQAVFRAFTAMVVMMLIAIAHASTAETITRCQTELTRVVTSDALWMNCGPSDYLRVKSAFWGRQDSITCATVPSFLSNLSAATLCELRLARLLRSLVHSKSTLAPVFSGPSSDITAHFDRECNSRPDAPVKYCYDYPIVERLGDPCPDVYKTAIVDFECLGRNCNGRGHFQAASDACVCNAGFSGKDCQCDSTACNGNGSCNYDGGCDCRPGFNGDQCQCSDAVTCNGQGTCDAQGKCVCNPPFFGPDCTCTRATTCNNHGSCTAEGTCTCDEGWAGANCNQCAIFWYPKTTDLAATLPFCSKKCVDDSVGASSAPNMGAFTCNSRGLCSPNGDCQCNPAAVNNLQPMNVDGDCNAMINISCENTGLRLSCPTGTSISVLHSTWGVGSKNIAPFLSPTLATLGDQACPAHSANCDVAGAGDDNATSFLQALCNFAVADPTDACKFNVLDTILSVFAQSCFEPYATTSLYLETIFECV